MFGNAILFTSNGGAARVGMHWQNGTGEGIDLSDWCHLLPRYESRLIPQQDLWSSNLSPAVKIFNTHEFEENGYRFVYVRCRVVFDHRNLTINQTGLSDMWLPTGPNPVYTRYGSPDVSQQWNFRLYGPTYYDYECVCGGEAGLVSSAVKTKEELFPIMKAHLSEEQLKTVRVNVDTPIDITTINYYGQFPIIGGLNYMEPIAPEHFTSQIGNSETYMRGTKFAPLGSLTGYPIAWCLSQCTVDEYDVTPVFGLPDIYGLTCKPVSYSETEFPVMDYPYKAWKFENAGQLSESYGLVPVQSDISASGLLDIARRFGGDPALGTIEMLPTVSSRTGMGQPIYMNLESEPEFWRKRQTLDGWTVEACVAKLKVSYMHA